MPTRPKKPLRSKAVPAALFSLAVAVLGAMAALEASSGEGPFAGWSGQASASPSASYDGMPEEARLAADDYVGGFAPAQRLHEPSRPGVVEYCPLDGRQRPVCAYGELTPSLRAAARAEGRQDISVDPPGWQGNEEVLIPALEGVEGSKDYRGWFWNRSHMVADSLGGSVGPENLVTGTRTQNVGSTQAGGMARAETIARDYLDGQADDSCPLYYSADPQYEDDELVPRSVRVEMLSCDGSVDLGMDVYNTANGWLIDYSTGRYQQQEGPRP